MRVGFVHEWITGYVGSEKVLAAAAGLFPGSPIHVTVYDPQVVFGTPLAEHPIHPSFIQRLPWSVKKHRLYLPLMPLAVESHDLRDYDVVISSSHAVAKGCLTRADQLHICYCHTPIRYVWDLHQAYLEQAGLHGSWRGFPTRAVLHYLRLWDQATAGRPDVYVANSRWVASRIAKTYRRDATVVYPPVETQQFRADQPRDEFFLVAGRLVPYKRVDLIVEAFRRWGRPVVIIGDGPDRSRIEQRAGGSIRVLGAVKQDVLVDHMQRCRAFVFAAEEDFGIAPVEAQAAGAPVIALGRGGATETVRHGESGLLFDAQTPESLLETLKRFDEQGVAWSAERIAEHARQFDRQVFEQRFARLVEEHWARRRTEEGTPG